MGKQIWKLQRPLFSSAGEYGEILAYTEGKENEAIIPVTMEIIDELFGDEAKIYVTAEVIDGNLSIDELVEEQPW